MNELVEVFEDVLAANFIYFSRKNTNFSVKFRVLPCYELIGKECLKVNVFFPQLTDVLFHFFELTSGSLVEFLP